MTNETNIESNIAALKRLRELPRGTHVDSRIAAVKSLLGDVEVFRTIQTIRWPLGVICPRCRSENVIRARPPQDATDQRNFYECLDCKGEGEPSGFDDLTNIDLGDTIHEFRQFILCWHLLAFCSISQIAKALGLSIAEVMQMADKGAQFTELSEKSLHDIKSTLFSTQTKTLITRKKKEEVEKDELKSRSKSLGKFKPGPKSSA